MSPDIDVHLRFKTELFGNSLRINADLSGDAFPNAEVFVEQTRTRRRTLIVTFETSHGPNTGPGVALWGDNRRPMGAICTLVPL
ncbi:MAG: hypothetical protein OXU20_19445 [Myxococcales bacterium]|nr:hypothetical protein [Myxococcales bacterium]